MTKFKYIIIVTSIILVTTILLAGFLATSSSKQKVPFVYDSKDFGKVEVRYEQKIAARDKLVIDGFPIDAPSHYCFDLEDTRPLPALEKGGRYFYPTYSFVCLIPLTDLWEIDFSKAYPNLNESALKLRKLLEERPRVFGKEIDIPDLPYNNSGRSILSKAQYLDFKAGSGILFLTQYSQDIFPNPINNEELTFNFQGLTKDGKYYIAARFAITHPSLPKGIDFTEYTQDESHLYLRNDEKKLERLSEESFRPSMKSLKTLISSILAE